MRKMIPGLIAIAAILIALLVLGGLGGCAHPPKRGTVIGNFYRPAHYNDWVSFYCAAYNSKGACTLTLPVYHHDYVPARYQIQVRKDADDTSKVDNTGWWDVDKTTYDRCPRNAHFPNCATDPR